MEELDQFSDIKGLKELTSFIDRYCIEFMTPDCKFDPVSQMIMDIAYEDLVVLSSDEAYANSFKLHSYCIYLRKNLDKSIAKRTWCEETLNSIVARNWKSQSEYMKYEVKRQAIIAEDTFAEKVEKMRIYLTSAIAQTEDKIYSVKRMADILQEIGKKKSYDR
jgi:hypothetical protein